MRRVTTDGDRDNDSGFVTDEFLRFAFEASFTGAWEVDLVDHTARWTPEYDRIFGYQQLQSEWTYEKFLAHVAPEDRAAVDEKFRAAVAAQTDWSFECRIRPVDGEIRWIRGTAQHRLDADGRPRRMAGIVQDITEQRQTAEALRTTESRYRALMNSIDVGFCIVEVLLDVEGVPADYRFLELNSQFERLTGLVRTRGKRMLELTTRDERFWSELYGRVAATGEPMRFEHPSAQSGCWLDARVFPVGEPSERQIAVLLTDISERRRHETELAAAQERLSLAQRASSAGIWDWDVRTGTIVWSDEQFQIFGLDPTVDQASFDTWRRIVRPDDLRTAEETIYRAIRDHQPLFNEYRIVLSSGEQRWIQAFGNTFYNQDGEPLRMIGLCLDVTETKVLTEAAAVANAASQAKSSFMAMMSHELRTPLNSIIGFTDVVLDGLSGELTDDQRKQLTIVKQSGRLLLELVAEILDMAHIEAGTLAINLQPVALASLLREQCDQVELQVRERGLQFTGPACDESITVLADPRRLGQVVRNLLTNAIKFTDHGSVSLRVFVEGGKAKVVVEDTGIGIRADQQDELFKSFHRIESRPAGSRPGTGLGLAISRRLVEAMVGTIAVDSEPGRGSRFWFTVPLAAAAPADRRTNSPG
jgi:PAS domain S-box-containing protein